MQSKTENHTMRVFYLLARTDIKRTVKTSDYSESDLALRVARIENHLGL